MADSLDALGEFGIIGLFRAEGVPGRRWVVTGIGDDCAVLDAGGDERLLVTTDMLVEHSHFLRDGITPYQLGHKTMAVNLSDIAAMGGEPTAAFLAMGLTRDLDVQFVRDYRQGLLDCARDHRVDLLGGDTVSCRGDLVLCLTLLGRAGRDEVILRSGARPGHTVMVGGVVGDSAAGLHLVLGRPGEVGPRERALLLEAHRMPRAQVALGRLLATRHMATAMIDVSDGVLQDLGHVCAESGVGADLDADRLPVSDAARSLARAAGRDVRDWALSGGEDFVLLFCVPAGREEEVRAACRAELGAEVWAVGTVTGRKGVRVGRGGVWTRMDVGGHDHFRARDQGGDVG